MKRMLEILAVLMITASFYSCVDNRTPNKTAEETKLVSVTGIMTNSPKVEMKNEVSLIGREGFRLVELSTDGTALQQSVWKLEGEKWQPTEKIKAVEGSTYRAIFPAGKQLKDDENMSSVIIKPGINNMVATGTITNFKAEIEFKHKMCRISYAIETDDGTKIIPESAKLSQPEEAIYQFQEDMLVRYGDMKYLDIKSEDNYIIPNENAEYIFRFTIDGKPYFYKTIKKIKANKNYKFTLEKINDNQELTLKRVSIEDWEDSESEHGELTQGDYKYGDKVPEGVYYAYITHGQLRATTDAKDKNIIGILLSQDNHQFIVSLTNASTRSAWQKGAWDIHINNVVSKTTRQGAEADFNGDKNTEAMMAWISSNNDSPAATAATKANITLIKGWYLPSMGELKLIMNNAEKINSMLNNSTNCEKIEPKKLNYWSSTACGSKGAWFWHGNINSPDFIATHSQLVVRPIIKF